MTLGVDRNDESENVAGEMLNIRIPHTALYTPRQLHNTQTPATQPLTCVYTVICVLGVDSTHITEKREKRLEEARAASNGFDFVSFDVFVVYPTNKGIQDLYTSPYIQHVEYSSYSCSQVSAVRPPLNVGHFWAFRHRHQLIYTAPSLGGVKIS